MFVKVEEHKAAGQRSLKESRSEIEVQIREREAPAMLHPKHVKL